MLTKELNTVFGLIWKTDHIFHDKKKLARCIGKLWKFAIALKIPMTNACYFFNDDILEFMVKNTRVCQPGQLQRLMIGVVQGRIPGVNIDGVDFQTKKNGDESLTLFFKDQRRKDIDDAKMMSEAAQTFIKENGNIDVKDFIKQLKSFWKWQGYPGKLRLK